MNAMTSLTSLGPFVVALTLFATTSSPARAAPEFPGKIATQLHLDYEPPCSICHELGKTGDGTPIELFAWSMRARGLTGQTGSLKPALTADQTDNVDSDGDGITDIEELEKGTDLNSTANDCIIPSGTVIHGGQCTPGVQPSPNLGCSMTRGRPARPGASLWMVAACLLGFATMRTRRARLARRPRA